MRDGTATAAAAADGMPAQHQNQSLGMAEEIILV